MPEFNYIARNQDGVRIEDSITADNLKEASIYLEKAKSINPNIAPVGWNETRLLLKQNKVKNLFY